MNLSVHCRVVVFVSVALVFASQQALSKNALESALRDVERSICKAVKTSRCANRIEKPHISRPKAKKAISAPAPIEKPTTTKPVVPTAPVEKPTATKTVSAPAPAEKPSTSKTVGPPAPDEKPSTTKTVIPPAPVEKPAPPLPREKPPSVEDIPPEPTIEAVPPSTPKPYNASPKSMVIPPSELVPAQKFPADAAQCQAALTQMNVNFAPNPAYGQQGSCLIVNPVQLKFFTLNGQKLEFPDQPNFDCTFALQFINFIRESAEPTIAIQTSSHIAKLYTGPGFVCRGRNGDISAKLSEHASGNAVDIERIQLLDGRTILVKDAISPINKDYGVLTTIRHAACKYFTTVLGPGANEAHASHFHFDLGQHGKSGTYRICE